MTIDATPVTSLTLPVVKQWLVVQHDNDDGLINDCIEAAMGYVANFCGIDFALTPPDKTLTVAIKSLVGHYYENREATAAVTLKDLPLSFWNILNQYRSITP